MFGCGGGGGSKEPDPVIITLPTTAILYSYTVTLDADTRSYTGKGVSVNDIIYVSPSTLSDSGFSVVGEIIGNEVRLFDYVTRNLVVQFTNGDDSGYHLEVSEVKQMPKISLSNIPGQWFNNSSAGMFGDAIMSLSNDSGVISGSDTSGCAVNGEIFESDNALGVELTLSDCDDSGEYYGSMYLDGGKIIGSVIGVDKGIMLNYGF